MGAGYPLSQNWGYNNYSSYLSYNTPGAATIPGYTQPALSSYPPVVDHVLPPSSAPTSPPGKLIRNIRTVIFCPNGLSCPFCITRNRKLRTSILDTWICQKLEILILWRMFEKWLQMWLFLLSSRSSFILKGAFLSRNLIWCYQNYSRKMIELCLSGPIMIASQSWILSIS